MLQISLNKSNFARFFMKKCRNTVLLNSLESRKVNALRFTLGLLGPIVTLNLQG